MAAPRLSLEDVKRRMLEHHEDLAESLDSFEHLMADLETVLDPDPTTTEES